MALSLFLVSVFLISYAYFGYWMGLSILHRFRRIVPVGDKEDPEWPPVTMLVSAHNEECVIAGKIANFLDLDYPLDRLSLWVGSDGSTDQTVALASSLAQSPRVRVVDIPERRGKVNVISQLMKEVTTPLVVLSDANTLYERDALKRLVRHFSDERVGAVCGRLVLVNEDASACQEETFYWRYETRLKVLESDLGTLCSINGQVMALRTELFQPPPQDIITEDQYLGLSILLAGRTIRFEPEAVVQEPVGSLKVEKARHLRISTGNFQTLFRIGWKALDPRRGFLAWAYLSHKVLRWMVPGLMILALGASWMPGQGRGLRIVAVAQTLFYAGTLWVGIAPRWRSWKPLGIAHYFLTMNLVILQGFVLYLLGRHVFPWPRTQRRPGFVLREPGMTSPVEKRDESCCPLKD